MNLCHLGDLIDELYGRVKVQPPILAFCRDGHGGIGCGATEGYGDGFWVNTSTNDWTFKWMLWRGACLKTALCNVS